MLPHSNRFWLLVVSTVLLLFAFANSAAAVPAPQVGSPWAPADPETWGPRDPVLGQVEPFHAVTLEPVAMQKELARAPSETIAAPARPEGEVISLPMPDGSYQRFSIVESPIMAPELAARYPDIKTYAGQGLDDPTAMTRLDFTPLGFHAIIFTASGTAYIDPYDRPASTRYISYWSSDFRPAAGETFFEPAVSASSTAGVEAASAAPGGILASSGTQLRTYRLALATTVEYTQFQGGTVANALAAMVTTMNRVNGIYEREVAIRMVLIANTNLLIYTTEPDPYTNNNGETMLGENQSNVDDVIGDANYDIGHVFSTGGGGIASLGVPCRSGVKARGVTGRPSPVGDPFDVDYVAHEMGHQFGGNHTFNSVTGSCGGGNRNASTAYEPGSGSTIMAYAGICPSGGGGDNLQPNSDPYFHTVSFDEIIAYSTAGAGNNCPTVTNTGNNPPNVPTGSGGFNIPRDTPFVMTGSATDPDGDVLTYHWEEFDLPASSGPPPPLASYVVPPFFRSFNPTASGSRIFPTMNSIVNNTTSLGEILPSDTRTLNFRLTVRDNRAGGGGVNYAAFAVSAVVEAGPFRVTAPNTALTWYAGDKADVTWDVANTVVPPVNCASVDIGLSTDGGYTYPTMLAAATPNDGAQQVNVPVLVSTTARVRVQCATNIFFDISNANFQIAPVADLSIAKSDDPDPVNAGDNLRYAIAVSNAGPFAAENVRVTDVLPAGVTYLANTDTCTQGPIGTLTCTLGSIPAGAARSFEILVRVDAGLVKDAGGPVALTNSATVASTTMDLDLTNNTDVEGTIVKDEADLVVTKFCKPETPVQAGQPAVCSIFVKNLGPSFARSVSLLDEHVSNASFTIASAVATPSGVCVVSPSPHDKYGKVECTLGDLAPGAESRIDVTLSANEPQSINDTARASSVTPDPQTANNVATGSVQVVGVSDLKIVKTATPSPVIAGTQLTYNLQVTNGGPSKAVNVVIKDMLPAGVTIVSVSAAGGACNAGEPGNATKPTVCTFDSLNAGDSSTMQIVVTVLPGTTGILHNDAAVSSANFDPNNSNDLTSTDTTVKSEADLSITKTDNPDPVVAGQKLTYEVTISNGGPSMARTVTLSDALPAEVTFTSATISNGTGTCVLQNIPPNTVFCNLNDLDPGKYVKVFVDTVVKPSVLQGTVINNTATATAATSDANAGNNTATASTQVTAVADLSIAKDARADYTNPSPRVVYTIVVTNLGPSDAQAVVMTDPLPLTAKKLPFLYYTGAGPAAGACAYTKSTHTFACNFGTIAAGDSRTVDVWLDARGSVGTITNIASVSSSTSDPKAANDSARKDVKIKGGPGPK